MIVLALGIFIKFLKVKDLKVANNTNPSAARIINSIVS
jgi:hypothetical protein